jgi:hypothetical protein
MPNQNPTRAFDLKSAQAGAPITRRDGVAARFVAYVPEADRYEQVLYLAKTRGGRSIFSASAEGRACHSIEHGADLLLAPSGFIDGKPVFVGDTIVDHGQERTVDPLNRDFAGCAWPVRYPETAMTKDDLNRAFNECGNLASTSLQRVANAALRHAIDSGAVVTKADHEAALIRQGERLQAVAVSALREQSMPPRDSNLVDICSAFSLREDGDSYCIADRIIHHIRNLQAAIRAHEAEQSQPAGAAKGRNTCDCKVAYDGEARAKRDLKVAEAVRDAARNYFTQSMHAPDWIKSSTGYGWVSNLDLPAIIASIQD